MASAVSSLYNTSTNSSGGGLYLAEEQDLISTVPWAAEHRDIH